MRSRLLVLMGLAFSAAACGGGGDKAAGASYPTGTTPTGGTGATGAANTITGTDGLSFTPVSLTVARGTTVTFAFQVTGHSVNFTGANAPSNIPESSNTSVQRTFSVAGSYAFTCGIHSYMYGSIVVQ